MCTVSAALFRGTNSLMAQWRQKDDYVCMWAWGYVYVDLSANACHNMNTLDGKHTARSTLQQLDALPAFRCSWTPHPGHSNANNISCAHYLPNPTSFFIFIYFYFLVFLSLRPSSRRAVRFNQTLAESKPPMRLTNVLIMASQSAYNAGSTTWHFICSCEL